MLRGVRAQAFQILGAHRISLLDQLTYNLRLIGDRRSMTALATSSL